MGRTSSLGFIYYKNRISKLGSLGGRNITFKRIWFLNEKAAEILCVPGPAICTPGPFTVMFLSWSLKCSPERYINSSLSYLNSHTDCCGTCIAHLRSAPFR